MAFQIPTDIFNDILYCQKSLRQYIKVHQVLVMSLITLNKQPDARIKEIEQTILDIGADQKKVLNALRLSMEKYIISLDNDNIQVNRTEINDLIAKQISENNQLLHNGTNPINVAKRLSDNELYEHFKLNEISDIAKQVPILLGAKSIVVTDDDEDNSHTVDYTNRQQTQAPERLEILINPVDITNNQYEQYDGYLNNSVKYHQESLLKPIAERSILLPNNSNSLTVSLHGSVKSRTYKLKNGASGIIQQKPSFMPAIPAPVSQTSDAMNSSRLKLIQALKKAHKNPPPLINLMTLTSPLPPSIPKVQQYTAVSNKSSVPVACATTFKKSIGDQILTTSSQRNGPTRVTAALQRAVTLNTLAANQTNNKSPNISGGSSDDGMSSPTNSSSQNSNGCESKTKSTIIINPIAVVNNAKSIMQTKRRNLSKSPSPLSSASTGSFDAISFPDEDDEPVTLGKEAFLRVVGLCTHTYHSFLVARRSARKRRSVTSTEKVDFHYGKVDHLLDEKRLASTRTNNKRTLLFSPPATRGNKRRKPNPTVANNIKPPLTAINANNDDAPMCISCSQSDKDKEKMSECESCNGFYHLSCHKTATIDNKIGGDKGQEKYCPDCFRRQQKLTSGPNINCFFPVTTTTTNSAPNSSSTIMSTSKIAANSQLRDNEDEDIKQLNDRNKELRECHQNLTTLIEMGRKRTKEERKIFEENLNENRNLEQTLTILLDNINKITGQKRRLPKEIYSRFLSVDS